MACVTLPHVHSVILAIIYLDKVLRIDLRNKVLLDPGLSNLFPQMGILNLIYFLFFSVFFLSLAFDYDRKQLL